MVARALFFAAEETRTSQEEHSAVRKSKAIRKHNPGSRIDLGITKSWPKKNVLFFLHARLNVAVGFVDAVGMEVILDFRA